MKINKDALEVCIHFLKQHNLSRVHYKAQMSDESIEIDLSCKSDVSPLTHSPIQGHSEVVAVQNNAQDQSIHAIQSPLVGTFYRAPSPQDSPFTDVGQSIKKGDIVCIIEAMKIMNRIEADADGVIQKIHLKDGDPVEFGQDIFTIKT